jgi:hypothetical protein
MRLERRNDRLLTLLNAQAPLTPSPDAASSSPHEKPNGFRACMLGFGPLNGCGRSLWRPRREISNR